MSDWMDRLRFYETSIEKYINIVTIFSVFSIFTIYAYLYAGNNNIVGGKLLSIIVLISSLRLLFIRNNFNYNLLVVFLSFFYMLLLSSVFYPSNYVDFEYTKRSIYILSMSLVIIFSFYKITEIEINYTRLICIIVFIAISATAILIEYNFLDKNKFDFFNFFKIVQTAWNNKFYSYWFVFLMWFVVASLWKKSILFNILSLVVVVLCSWAVLLTDSESAQLAIIVSVVFFVLLNLKLDTFFCCIYCLPPLSALMLPVGWIILFPVMDLLKEYPIFHEYVSKINGIYARIPIYDACAQLIRKKIILGYGFGSAMNVPIDPIICGSGGGILPGGHPHNMVFMSFVEQGIFGYLWLAATVSTLCYFVYKTTFKKNEGPAVYAMVISALIIFSFSFDVWDVDVVMLYVMFLVLLRVAIGKIHDTTITSKALVVSSRFLIANVLIGSIVYIVNFFTA